MHTISRQSLSFLKELKKYNNRDWFQANKARYDTMRSEFEAFVDALIARIAKFDSSVANRTAKECVFRIYRDVRFSKDKSPYKTNIGAHITSAASKSEIHSRAGYYIHIEPGASILAGGAYLPQSTWLSAIRDAIATDAAGLKNILNGKAFRKYFGAMEGEKLSRPPKGYDAGHPHIELLKHKSFLAVNNCADSRVTSPDFLQHCAEVCRALKPFDDFLNRA